VGATPSEIALSDYGYKVEVRDGYDEAVVRTRLALRAEGFSIITEMHVGGLLGQSDDRRQYLIMGSWAPVGASDRLQDGLEVASHVPCNIVVQESGPSAIVAALDPADEVPGDTAANARIATEAQEALARVLQRVGDE
jgi:uncharacterized protein (DUF302 family)